MEDQELWKRYLAEGSREVLGEIAERYQSMVFKNCQAILHDRGLAEDATQASFLVLYQKARSLGPRLHLGAWLARTAVNIAHNARRNRQKVLRHERLGIQERPLPVDPRREGDPVEEGEVRAKLSLALAKLPNAQRQALVLHFYRGFSQERIAMEMGCSQSTVSATIQKGLARIRQRMGAQLSGTGVVLERLWTITGEEAAPEGLSNLLRSILNDPAQASPLGQALARLTVRQIHLATAKTVLTGILASSAIFWVLFCLWPAGKPPSDPPPLAVMAETPAEAEEEEKKIEKYASYLRNLEEDNAALQYWLASDPFQGLQDEMIKDLKPESSPETLKNNPDIRRLAACDVSILFFKRGVAMSRCNFNPNWDAGPGALLPHISIMRKLAKKIMVYGKVQESEGDTPEAIEVYAGLIRMGIHLGQEPLIISQLAGTTISDLGMGALESLLSRQSSPPIPTAVQKALQGLPVRPFLPEKALEGERMIFGFWARKNILEVTALARSVFQDQFKKLGWTAPGDLNLPEGADEMIRPTMDRFLELMARAQARLSALKILAAAYVQKAKDGTPPKNLEALKTAFPEGLSKDPFTGKDFVYQIKDGRPTVSFSAPEPPEQTGTSPMNPAGPRTSPQGKSQGGDDF